MLKPLPDGRSSTLGIKWSQSAVRTWAQEVSSSNLDAPTNPFNNLRPCRMGVAWLVVCGEK